MLHIPFVGRLRPWEYFYLVSSFLLIALESFVRIVTLALPGPIIHLFYRASRRSFNYLSSPQGKQSRNKKKGLVTSIAQASDFVELAELFGYYAEEHIVQTGDGYLLGLHRLGWRRGEEEKRVNSGPGSIKKKVVYLHHGLMMNSDVWVCLTEKERSLPFLLVERGYDVWLGNNRGNKYSKKSTRYAPTDPDFWNFSIDQFAFHDIPDSIDYVLSTTGQPSLSYIGFSQGTAQAFAALSIHPPLNDKVEVFIALAPAMSPKGMNSGVVDTFVKTSPDVLFLAFGRRAILSSATMWQALLYPPIFVRFIDVSLSFLFGWKAKNIATHQKMAAYPHLYSFSSTKSVVHWFQIIRNGKFQMYDDEVQSPFSISTDSKYYKVAKFPTRNIKTPIVLVYGGSDSLVDINVMLKELPKHTTAKEIPHYEHLDFLWASDVNKLVFPYVFEALEEHAAPGNSPKVGPYQTPNTATGALKDLPSPSEEESPGSSRSALKISENVPAETKTRVQIEQGQAESYADTAKRSPKSPEPKFLGSPAPIRTPKSRIPSATAWAERPQSSHESQSHVSHKSTTSRPEGWWSSDEVAGTDSSPTGKRSPRSPSVSSQNSKESKSEAKFGTKGITIGAGRVVSGLVGGEAFGSGSSTAGKGGKENRKKKSGKK